jgi:hypothetical protein
MILDTLYANAELRTLEIILSELERSSRVMRVGAVAAVASANASRPCAVIRSRDKSNSRVPLATRSVRG